MSLRPCPACDSRKCDVKDSRPSQLGVRRRILCRACGHRWSTVEVSLDEEKRLRSLESSLRAAIRQANDLSTGLSRLLVTRDPVEPEDYVKDLVEYYRTRPLKFIRDCVTRDSVSDGVGTPAVPEDDAQP